jgi:hypothetical protein
VSIVKESKLGENELPVRSGWKLKHDDTFGCWLWVGYIDRDGYGTLWRGKSPTQAHRAVYRELIGEIADGMRLDHLCRRRNCVRPDHLEPVTESENQRRRTWRARVRQPRCRAGHDLRVHVMVTPEGGRLCRLCQGPR